MDANLDRLQQAFNEVREEAAATGMWEEGRLQRALGLIVEGELPARVQKYSTTPFSCGCMDCRLRGQTCKHQLALVILQRAGVEYEEEIPF